MSVSRHPGSAPLRALLVSHTLSRTGNVITVFAVPFAVLSTGGDAVQVGIAAAATTAPIVIGGPLGGALVDRLGHVRSSVLSDLISGANLALIPLLAGAGLLPFGALLALVFLGGLLDTPGETARRVLLPPLSEQARIPIERSIGFLDGTTRLSTLLGAPLAGILVASLGPYPALYLTATAFAASALLTATAVRLPAGTLPGRSGRSYWRDLKDGFQFVVHDPLLIRIIGLVLITNTLDAARSGTLMPLYAVENLNGPGSLGIVVGTFGAAAFIGTVVFGYIAHRLPRRIPFTLCFTIAGGYALAPAFGFHTPGMIATAALCGLAAGALNPIIGAVQYQRVPAGLRARVFGLVTAGAWAGMPLGGLVGGVGASLVGVRPTFAIIAVIYITATLTPLLGGAWRLMERSTPTEPRRE
ncbi:MFS transporter [Brachybacterium paraconglomeratum]|uniref:MFS transporter n=1 Tax=Brachybacterium paraconglomeratum TaxID=173362 RepID=UPI0022AEDB31|nr:MFS transporter [Brachybacterium paraconglomeratum]MCZ4328150.1 MFS transporter [Brachybacterium paraconglomeratum]